VNGKNTVSIAPSPARILLPHLPNPPSTIIEFLCQHFPAIGEQVWIARIVSGKVHSENQRVTLTTPYRQGLTVSYYREVESEVEIPFKEEIIFENDHLLVADKPHFLPVTPAGQAVNECLLYRLQKRLGVAHLAPLHRLDRDTAGVVLFGKVPTERALYNRLFADRNVAREYLAVAVIPQASTERVEREWWVENHLRPDHPWFRMRIATGRKNASTRIALRSVHGSLGLFELHPQTGKKHQLRVHLMSLGFPILNDCFYPDLQSRRADDYSQPLQLLAKRISFKDPVTGKDLIFQSKQRLASWPE
jgi:tRNA pseudouridine32 synthase / 23S rRNA pseudouridine746 synthase